VEADLKKDLLHVAYHADTITPPRMQEVIRAEGFRGEIVKEDGPSTQ
jgi:hypothetical protein